MIKSPRPIIPTQWTHRTGMQVEPKLLGFQQANPGHLVGPKLSQPKYIFYRF